MSNFPPAPLAVLREAELPPAAAGRGDKVVKSAGKTAATAAADEEDTVTEGKETGAAGGECAGQAAATAAADEEDIVTEGKETGAAGGESAGETAATAAADEDDTATEGKETGAAGGESAGEAAVTATLDEEVWAGKGAAAPPASVVHGAAGAAAVEVEAPTQTADASNCTDSPVAEAGTAEAAASISIRI